MGLDARIAIAQVDNADLPVRGYQLVVVDAGHGNKQICKGPQLAGVVFNHLYTDHDEPVVIRQVAQAKVTPDIPGAQACVLDEYRIAYLIASVHRPDDSVCTHDLHNGKLHRGFRKVVGFDVPDLPPVEISSKLLELPLIFPEQLENYAVVMPNADYDSDGEPQVLLPDPNLPKVPYPALEWYELACGGGALAHTDLDGLVELGEAKEIRTAALRMLRANYRGNRTETLEGVPISFQRNKAHTPQYEALCESLRPPQATPQTDGSVEKDNKSGDKKVDSVPKVNTSGDKKVDSRAKITAIADEDVEARWASAGAVCVTKSRLWRRDGVVTAARHYHGDTLYDREVEFLKELQGLPAVVDTPGCRREDVGKPQCKPAIPTLEVPCKSDSKKDPRVWFTSGVLHHI